ncbi:hypothetical protein EVJ58_g3353 [Rhodofomes roseus]|uniref:Retrotransposon gag domain-containing protein n=1 Tax=Rhodofomes roseus TaxID=34475 RepID=A0A4Y9YNG8_9APHY|nr:hypothetical protein EVJ58_g3353 [Rhodofomes roseus]
MANAMTGAQILEMIQGLAQGLQQTQTTLGQLTTQVTALANNSGRPSDNKSTVQRPATYSGKSSPDARRFVAAFSLYAQEMGSKLNTRVGDLWQRDDQRWVRSALSFLTDEAAVWATPYIEAMVAEKPAFSNWDAFVTAFKLRFETQDESADAKKALRELYQGKLSVPEYAARFREVMERTGYSDGDLRDRFYEHLSNDIKDLLPTTERSTKTLDELMLVAADFDTRLRQRRAEKAREAGKTSSTSSTSTPVRTTAAPFVISKDPNAMDIDATLQAPKGGNGKTRADFLKVMGGRCFGCGSKDHVKRDGGHERDICDWCGGTGHKTPVCQRRFLGLPKKATAAATSSTSSTDKEVDEIFSPETSSSTSEEKTVAATSQMTDVVNAMLKQQAELAAQIEALKKAF